MTPKEKAMELVGTIYQDVDADSVYDGMTWDMAKQCALICVDEILNDTLNPLVYEAESEFYLYWEEVKNEIKEL